MALKAKRSTPKPTVPANTKKEILGLSTQVMLNMGMLRSAGKKYSSAVDVISRYYGNSVLNVEMYVQRHVGDDDYVCSFQSGKIRQEVKVPVGCFSNIVPPAFRCGAGPSSRLTKPLRFPMAAAERVVVKEANL